MSVLGKLLRTYLSGRPNYATTIPGGISPEIAAVGVEQPHIIYQGISRTRDMLLSNVPAVYTERIQLLVIADTRSEAQTVSNWIVASIQATPARQTIDGIQIHLLRVDDEIDSSELAIDGSDEQTRVTTIDVIGVYQN